MKSVNIFQGHYIGVNEASLLLSFKCGIRPIQSQLSLVKRFGVTCQEIQ